MYRISVLLGWYLFLGFYGVCKSVAELTPAPVTFTFKEYQYKDSPKNEMTFREFETACEQSGACSHLAGLARTRCVRECVSPSCYRDLYQTDPLFYNLVTREDTLIHYVIKRRIATKPYNT